MTRGTDEPVDDRRLALWEAFLTTHAAVVRRLADELERQRDLPLSWYEVLLYLNRAPERRMRMGELSGSLLLTPSGLTRLIDRMEAAGLVRRDRCPSDRRGAYAALTPAGRARLEDAAPVHLRGIDRHFARHLGDRDVAVLERALRKVREALEQPGD